jgi:hypothetical protein
VQKRTKNPEDRNWVVFHAEAQAWIIIGVLIVSVATVLLLAYLLAQG